MYDENVFANEVNLCHMLARTLKTRCVIVQIGSLICTILPADVEPGVTVLYATL